MLGDWGIHESQEILALVVVLGGAGAVLVRSARGIARAIEINHAKLEAVESLVEATQGGQMTPGAAAALARMERHLLVSAAQIRLVMEQDGAGYIETDGQGNLTYANTQFVLWTDMTLEKAKGRGWIRAIHPEDRGRVVNEWDLAVRDRRVLDVSYRYVDSAGKATPVTARCAPVATDAGEVIAFVCLITEEPQHAA